MTQTGSMTPRTAIAVAAALTISVGAGVGLVASRGGDPRPAALAQPTPTPSRTPAAAATPAARPSSPTPKPTPAPQRPRATAGSPYSLPAAVVLPSPCPPPPPPPGKPRPFGPPTVAESDVPAPVKVPARTVSLRAAAAKGMWLTTWPKSTLDADAVVSRAKAAGLRQLWIRTGGTKQGYYGDRLLAALLPKAHAAGIAVIAWDFPFLSDPVADVARAERALAFTVQGQRIDGFSPDIETKAEGVHATSKRVAAYLSRVQVLAGDRPVVATVPRPTPKRLASYPYRATAPYVDGYTAMIYWSCLEPGETTRNAIRELRKLGKPVAVVGQAYDMGPEGGRQGLPAAGEIWRFLDVAKRAGAFGASLYQYDTAGPSQWAPLARYPW